MKLYILINQSKLHYNTKINVHLKKTLNLLNNGVGKINSNVLLNDWNKTTRYQTIKIHNFYPCSNKTPLNFSLESEEA